MKTTTRERPILFSAPMVKAILEWRKRQTRRVVKPQLGPGAQWNLWEGFAWRADGLLGDIPVEWRSRMLFCPYGEVGDLLWVRETWVIEDQDGGGDAYGISYVADGPDGWTHWPKVPESERGRYLADERKRPSIHMPRWASRITLEITDVRVQRINEISDDDCRAEGLVWGSPDWPTIASTYHHAFRLLWDSINGKGAWERNDWVWVIGFRRIDQKDET